MPRYSEERKAAILKKLLPPHNKTIPEVAAEDYISEATLYNWRNKLRSEGKPVPGNQKNSEHWSAEAKFATDRSKPPVCQKLSLASIVARKVCTLNKLKRGNSLVSAVRVKQSNLRKQSRQSVERIKSVSENWKQSCIVKTKPWQKRRRYWCCQKSSRPCMGATARRTDSSRYARDITGAF